MAHAGDSDAQILVVTLDVVKQHLLMLKLVLQRCQVCLLLVFRINLVWLRVKSFVEFATFGCRLLHLLSFTLIAVFCLRFADFFINLRLDLSQLLLRLLVIICKDHESFSLMFKQLGVHVRFLLQTHRLGLIETCSGFYELLI